MAKKIVLVGDKGVGKSTIRKWIFEGESLFKLLEKPMEPTYGFENYSYNLIHNLGVFDLAGQENHQWFSEEKAIFDDSDIILNVVDSRKAIQILTKYIDDALVIETAQSRKAKIFFLIHKIDLIDEIQKQKILKKIIQLKNKYKKENSLKLNFFFTSIIDTYIYETINAFIEIFRESGLDKTQFIDPELLKYNFELFHMLLKEKKKQYDALVTSINLPKTYHNLIDLYIQSNFLQAIVENKQEFVSLTEKGQKYFETILKSFEEISISDFKSKENKKNLKIEEEKSNIQDEKLIYGLMISDSNGITISIVETKTNSLYNILNRANNPEFDLELIPMFLNAMSKFAQEINVQNLASFGIQGGNIKMASLSKEDLTFTLFSHPNLKIDVIRDDLSEMFNNFVTDHQQDLADYRKTGNTTIFAEFIPRAKQKIHEILSKYSELSGKIRDFNVDEAKKLYERMNLVNEKTLSLEEQLELKSFKVKLLESIISEDKYGFALIENDISKLTYSV